MIGVNGELCQPKGQRELSGGTLCKILVVILRYWIGPHFEHMYFYGIINLLVMTNI